ncbi:MAG: transposase [Acidobacteria bacterium]|nr:transposase [Acidobacteriota bacterium]
MKRYDEEFKKGVIRRFMEGETMAALVRETGVNKQTLYKWKQELVRTEDGEVDKEKLAMRKEIRELRMEVEILKKAALIFGRGG